MHICAAHVHRHSYVEARNRKLLILSLTMLEVATSMNITSRNKGAYFLSDHYSGSLETFCHHWNHTPDNSRQRYSA